MAGGERVRPANPLWRRLLRQWRRWRGADMVKTHTVQIVERDGRRFKRVEFQSVEEAGQVARCLSDLSGLDRFPRLQSRRGPVLEVEFIAGPLARVDRPEDHQAVAEFFVDLYAGQPRRPVATATTGMARALAPDLEFLVAAGLIDSSEADRLRALAGTWQPNRVWLGHDYIDPIARNFVIRQGRAMAIDIEALCPDQPLGQGLSKATLRWLKQPAAQIVAALSPRCGEDLAAQLPWVRLCFTVAYFRQKLAQRKPGHIRVEALTGLGRIAKPRNNKPRQRRGL